MIEKFEKDLETGKMFEQKALEHIQNKYPKAYIIDGYFLEWDIFIPEIKNDEPSYLFNYYKVMDEN